MTYSGLLDFDGLTNNAVCGLSDYEIQELVDVQELFRNDSGLPIIDVNDDDFLDVQTDDVKLDPDELMNKSSTSLSSEVKSTLDALEMSSIPDSTRMQQKTFSQRFLTFLQEKSLSSDFAKMTKSELCDLLKYFYSDLRTKDNKFYSPASLNCIRAALFRFFRQPPYRLDIDIIHDVEFYSANQILKAMAKRFLENGGNVKHYESLEEADLRKLRGYFDRSTPEKLQEEVYFSIIYFLGQRGREWIRYVKKSNVLINTDSTGRKYVEICHLNSVQKNDQPTIARPKTDQKQSRFYQSNCESECPVLAIQMLLSRLPESAEYLFYKPLKNWQSSEFWYNTSLVIGSQTLGNMMKKISQNAKLSKVYTAHCIRATVVTEMFNNGAAVEDIQCITGHKNADSVKRYLKRVGDSKKQEYSRILVNSFSASTSIESASDGSEYYLIMFFGRIQCANSNVFISVICEAPPKRKMVVEADGNRNTLRITFE